MNYIIKAAIKLLRVLRGNISYTSLEQYIIGKGFMLVLMNTENGDEFLRFHGLYEECVGHNGKTIVRNNLKIVVIDSCLQHKDKICVMLHEIYHVDNHCNIERVNNSTPIQRDNEAEAFAYAVLHLQKYKILYNKYIQIITACVIAGVLALGIYLNYSPDIVQTTAITQVQPTITTTLQSTSEAPNPTAPAEPQISASTKYYVMPSGRVYHEEGCQHINKNAFEITIEEASKRGLPPCKTCKPDKD